MRKPKQPQKMYQHNDAAELLEIIEGAMNEVAYAMDEIRGYPEFADLFTVLGDIYDDMVPRYEEYEEMVSKEYRDEMDAMNHQYLRSVL